MRGVKRRQTSASASCASSPPAMRSTSSPVGTLSIIAIENVARSAGLLHSERVCQLKQQGLAVAAKRAAVHGRQRAGFGGGELFEDASSVRLDRPATHVLAQSFGRTE